MNENETPKDKKAEDEEWHKAEPGSGARLGSLVGMSHLVYSWAQGAHGRM